MYKYFGVSNMCYYVVFIFVFFFSFAKGVSCTDFILKDVEKRCVVGRSMEFGTDLKSEIFVVPRGGKKKSLINGKEGIQWTQNYAFVGLNALGNERLIIDGVNEKGLSIGGLWLPGTKYPSTSAKDLSHMIALEDVGTWILGSFATVAEAKKGLEQVTIFPMKIAALGEVPPLHFSLHDRLGNSLVVEFIDGQMQISVNPVGVLTNAPKFEWHITNLDNYINLSAMNKGAIRFDGTVLNPTGQGSGLLGLPGDWTPPSRFVKIAILKEFVTKPKTKEGNVYLAFHLLNTVDIPYGAIQEKSGKEFDYTQWIVVKDLTNGTLYYRTYENLDIKSVQLQEALKKGFHKIQMQ